MVVNARLALPGENRHEMNLHQKTVDRYSHPHDTGRIDPGNERRTRLVVLLTGFTMVIEIVAGLLTGSMALLADGWHMGTHTFALGISLAAYILARRYSESEFFSFGTGKFGVLAGYTSALFLAVAALWMIVESVSRFINPVSIAFDEAIIVTTGGLIVNLVSVLILHRSTGDGQALHHEDDHSHGHGHHDHSYRAAYLHVLADSLTSFLAIIALLSGRFLGWVFMDPVMGIVGGVMIIRWAYGLIHGTAFILLDGGVAADIRREVRRLVESDGESRVVDLHVWRVGSSDLAVIVSVVTGHGRRAEEYQNRLSAIGHLSHVSVEVHPCEDERCPCKAKVL